MTVLSDAQAAIPTPAHTRHIEAAAKTCRAGSVAYASALSGIKTTIATKGPRLGDSPSVIVGQVYGKAG